jgi:putative transposase
MRFNFIDAKKAEFPVTRMCMVLGVSQSGFHAFKARPTCTRQQHDVVLLAHVRSAFKLSNGTYGSPRMTRELQDEGHLVGRRRTARLMRENGLIARQKRRFKRTTDSEHSWPIAPNLLDQVFEAEAPDQKWSVDISFIWTWEGWLYLSIALDLFSRRVVGWTTSDGLHRALALAALRKALAVRQPAAGLIHHFDRGSKGRFNRSAQHPKLGGVYGDGKTEVGAVDAAKVILARSATGVAA